MLVVAVDGLLQLVVQVVRVAAGKEAMGLVR
jgi:hypothetical protein